MLFLEGVLAPGPELHDRRHIDLVEGRQHGGGLLSLHQADSDRLPPARHAHPLLAGIARHLARKRWPRAGRVCVSDRGWLRHGLCGRFRGSCRRSQIAGRGAKHILARNSSPRSSPCDGIEIDIVLAGQHAHGRGSATAIGRGSFFGRRGRLRGRRRRHGGRGRLRRGNFHHRLPGRAVAAAPAPSATVLDNSPTVTISPSLRSILPSTPSSGAVHVQVDFVCLQFDDRFAPADGITLAFQPLPDNGINERFAQWRDSDLDRHAALLLQLLLGSLICVPKWREETFLGHVSDVDFFRFVPASAVSGGGSRRPLLRAPFLPALAISGAPANAASTIRACSSL